MTMADRIAVLNHGRVLQVATPRELYHRPADRFVAAFIGKMNFIPGEVTGDAITTVLGTLPVRQATPPVTGPGSLAVRPEATRLLDEREAASSGEAVVTGTVEGSVFVGSQAHVHVLLDGGSVPFILTGPRIDEAPETGARVRIGWRVDESLVFPDPQSEPAGEGV